MMADRTEDLMNLDLNLGPGSPPSPVIGPGTGPSSGESVNVIGWESTYVREALRQRSRHRWRWMQGQLPLGPHSLRLMVEPDVNGGDPGVGSGVDGEDNGGTILAGEGSVTAELRSHEVVKTCENNVIPVENDSVAEKDVEKPNSEEGSFFDCNICFDLAKEPVVTCCGHLFCWPCIYRWLQIHSDAKECPVCKGEVSVKNVTPIYGRGNHIHEPEDDLDLGIKIPGRPSARRVESLRQTIQRTASSFPMEEMIRRLGARFELTRDYFQLPNADGDAEMPTRASILNRFMTSRALRREQNPPIAPDEVVDLTQDRPEILPRRLPPLTYRRGQLHRSGAALSPAAAAAAAADRYVDAYLHRSPPRRSQDVQPPPVDDRDSFSSIAAAIHGESQTMDTAVEIDSLVSISTSTSRRRHDPSRTSDMDSGDSRAPRRRRLN